MTQAEVLIVGAGPVGQVAALLLARQGIRSKLVDRRLAAATAPKAHAVNPRTLEICDSLGISADALRGEGASANDAGFVRFVGTLAGPQFGCLPYERQGNTSLVDTPFPLTNIPQPKFEAALSAAVLREPMIEMRRGLTCLDLREHDTGVTACLEDGETQTRSEHECAYVIAADGAGSRLRAQLGIAMVGPDALQHNVMIHFEADLSALTAARPGVLYFLFEPSTKGVLIAYDRAKTWVLMHPYDPAYEAPERFDDVTCKMLVEGALGQCCPDLVIRNVSPWVMSAQIAETYRKGRVFLAGDAAHRFPPTGGLGLNTGVVDAQNLAWKLSAVLKGEAGAALLDTYEAERRPVAEVNTEQSLTNAGKLFELFPVLFGNDMMKAAAHYEKVAANFVTMPELALAVEMQRPHFDSFNLQLGYRYNSSALLDAPALKGSADVNISDYQPSWEPGAHVPHRWVMHQQIRKSLLTLLPVDRFLLLGGPQSETWCAAAASLGFAYLQHNIHYTDDISTWRELTGLADGAALLVRPDGHIAARLSAKTEARADHLRCLVSQLLSKAS